MCMIKRFEIPEISCRIVPQRQSKREVVASRGQSSSKSVSLTYEELQLIGLKTRHLGLRLPGLSARLAEGLNGIDLNLASLS